MHSKLNLQSIDVGGGVVAVRAWFEPSSPIVLVETHGVDGSAMKSRLDLGKGMFIDPLPGVATEDGVERVVRGIGDAFQASSRG